MKKTPLRPISRKKMKQLKDYSQIVEIEREARIAQQTQWMEQNFNETTNGMCEIAFAYLQLGKPFCPAGERVNYCSRTCHIRHPHHINGRDSKEDLIDLLNLIFIGECHPLPVHNDPTGVFAKAIFTAMKQLYPKWYRWALDNIHTQIFQKWVSEQCQTK